MIELKISTDAAVLILTERMEFELKMRKNSGILPKDVYMNELSYKELHDIAEFAVSDLLMLMPIDIIVSESNLPLIISKAINELTNIYNHAEFGAYSVGRAACLLNCVKRVFEKYRGSQQFIYN